MNAASSDERVGSSLRTQRQLVLTRQLYIQGLAQVRRSHSAMARILGVVILDLAVETGMKTTLGTLEPASRLAKTFDGVLVQLDKALAGADLGDTPDRANILHVHEIRNDAQHRARTPTDSEANDSGVYVRDFLDKLMRLVWGKTLGAISLAGSVSDESVRESLKTAEERLAERSYREAAQYSALALTSALGKVRHAVVGDREAFTRAFVMREDLEALDRGSREKGLAFKSFPKGADVYRSFERMQEVLLLTWFRSLAGEAFHTHDGKHHFTGGSENIEDADAEFCVGYATESVLEIESRAGDLEAPFGQPSWF